MSDQAEESRLLFVTILIWVLIVTGSAAGFYTRELGRRRAEQSLGGLSTEKSKKSIS
jgi:hypothetical protein